uniref:Uncharacterized protein n=1 Tax=Arundo donax TaxID=35708 RepID=A0A0A9ATF6_ARUDO
MCATQTRYSECADLCPLLFSSDSTCPNFTSSRHPPNGHQRYTTSSNT